MKSKKVFSNLFKYGILILWTLIILLPLITVIFGSFKSYSEFNSTSGIAPPSSLSFENYKRVLIEGKLLSGFFNTFILVIFGVCGSVFVGSILAFALNRFNFKYKKLILGIFLLVSIVPIEVSQVATFKIINGMGLYNTRIAPILLYIGADMLTLYIYMQMLEKVPKDIDKAVILEGGSMFYLYRKAIFPIVRPATFTVCLLKTISIYNDFYIPFLYMPKEGLNTVSTTVFRFMSTSKVEWNVICAGIVLSIIPMLIFFIFLQKRIYNGIMEGSVKG